MPHRTSGRRRLVRFLPLVCLTAAVWSVAAERADAQFNMSDYLSRMDANGNGLLEPSEMSERFQSFWGATLKERGIDTSRPIPMDRLKPIMEERFERMRRERESSGGSSRFGSRGGDDRGRGSDRGRDEGRSDRGRDNRGSSSSSNQAAQPLLVPGFGNDFEPLPVPGFEVMAETEDNWESQFDRRTLEMVDDMLRRYDRDRSGVLERAEWANGQWRTDPATSDLDNDGRLTRKELAMRLASSSRSSEGDRDGDRSRGSWGDRGRPSFGSREGGDRGPGGWGGPPRDGDSGRGGWSRGGGDGGGWGRGGDGGGGGWFGSRDGGEPPAESRPSSTTSSSKTPTVTSYRFKTPTERLPKGMPEWFARLDINADGQVSMAEFASDWSVQQVAEFRSWDHNGDGIITPNECLAGQQSVETVASVASSGPAPDSMAQASAGVSGPPSGGPPSGGPSRFGSGGPSGRSGFGGSGFGPPGGSRSTGATPSGFGRPSSSPGGPAAGPPSSSAPATTTASATSSAPSNFSAGASNRYREIYTQKFREWDVNRNGVLDADEINPSVKSADTNGDGRITLDELLNRFAQPR